MRLIKKFTESKALKNIAKISSGTIMGQAISFVTVPAFTRMYGAEVLGIWALFTSIGNIVNSFSCLGLKDAIMIEKDEEKTEDIYTIITTITFFISVLLGIGSFVFFSFIDKSINQPPVISAVILAIMTFTYAQTQTCYTWLNKHSQYNVLMKNPIIQNASTAIIAIGLGVLGFKTYGYYIGVVAGNILTFIHMKIRLPKRMFNFKFEKYVRLLKENKEFIQYQLPINVLRTFKDEIPTFLLKTLFSTEVLGYYSIAMKYIKIPVNLLSNAIGRVFLQTVAQMVRQGEKIGDFVIRNMKRTMKLAMFPLMAILSVGDIVCSYMLGSDYLVSGNMLRILVVNCFFMFLGNACQGLPVVLHKQKYTMYSSIMQMFANSAALVIGSFLGNNIYIGLILMAAFYMLIMLVYFSAMLKVAEADWKQYVCNTLKTLGIVFVGALVIRLLLMFIGVATTI